MQIFICEYVVHRFGYSKGQVWACHKLGGGGGGHTTSWRYQTKNVANQCPFKKQQQASTVEET